MPATLTYPGVYVEEVPSGVHTITGVGTSITAFVGRAFSGPVNEAVTINSFGDYERIFGGLWLESSMSFAVRDFYLNGGSQAIIVRLFSPFFADDEARQTALTLATTQATKAASDVITAAGAKRAAHAADSTITDDQVASAAEGAVASAGAVSAAALSAATDVARAARAAVNSPPSNTLSDLDDVIAAAESKKPSAIAAAATAAVPISRARLAVGGAAQPLHLEAANEGSWGNDLRARIDYNAKAEPANLFNLTVKNTKTGQIEVHRNLSVEADSSRRVDKVLSEESQLIRTRVRPTLRPTNNKPDPKGSVPLGADPFDPTNSSGIETGGVASDGRTLEVLDFTPLNGSTDKHGIFALLQADLFNLLCLPPFITDGDMNPAVIGAAAKLCEDSRAMLLVDAPSAWKTTAKAVAGITAADVGTTSKNAAIYFPRLRQPNPLRENQLEEFAPCGAIAGVMARTDSNRGVWKAPAGQEASLVGVPALTVSLTDAENGQLNPLGVNCLRAFPLIGRVVWGARTMEGADQQASEWKYIPVRRTALYIEESLCRGTKWVVFEPNDEPLWAQIRLNVGAFMQNLFRQGAFQGKTPREAYFVKCDKETTTQNDINSGVVNILVGFAPLKPAEFVVLKIQQMSGQIET
jgi:phage tail sheath protein FI